MRDLLYVGAGALLLALVVGVADYYAFTKPCEARSANHIRLILGPCMVATETNLEIVPWDS